MNSIDHAHRILRCLATRDAISRAALTLALTGLLLVCCGSNALAGTGLAAEATNTPGESLPTAAPALTGSTELAYRLKAIPASADKVMATDNTDALDDPGQASPAQAGFTTDDEEPLTLIEACRLAIQNHPRIDYSEADRQEAEADWGIARSQYYPKIDWLTKIGPSGEMDTGKTEYGDSAVILSQKLFKFGGIQNAVDSANLKFQSAQLESSRTREDIAVLAINAFLTVLQSQELLRVHQGDVEFNQKLLESFKERYTGGVSSLADVQKMEVTLKDAQARVVQQNEQLSTAKSLLENIIGAPVSSLEPDMNLLNVTIDGSIDESCQRALASNLKLKSLIMQIEAQHKSISATKSDYLPELSYRLQVKNEFQELKAVEEFTQTGEAQLNLNWTLFNGYSTSHEMLKKKAVLRRLKSKMRSAELEIKNVLTDAMNSYASSAAEYALAKEAFDSSINLMTLYLNEFDIGIRTLLELTAARDGQTNAALRQVNTRFNRSRSALNILLEEGRLQSALNLPLDTLNVPQGE